MTQTTTYAQLLDRVIADGIAAARADYADKPDKLRGAVDGFEACRGKTPDEIVANWQNAERQALEQGKDMRVKKIDGPAHVAGLEENDIVRVSPDTVTYWYWRCYALEVEWVLNVLSVGLSRPLLAHLPTHRGAMKYAEIVGVRGEGVSA